jgi:hypothetical protein
MWRSVCTEVLREPLRYSIQRNKSIQAAAAVVFFWSLRDSIHTRRWLPDAGSSAIGAAFSRNLPRGVSEFPSSAFAIKGGRQEHFAR